MQSTHLQIAMHRALQRMIETVIGAPMTWLVLGLDLAIWDVIAILAILQVATEVIIGFKYGPGQILFSAMVLPMTALGDPKTVGAGMVAERVLDTLIGATIGMVVTILLSSSRDRHGLANRPGIHKPTQRRSHRGEDEFRRECTVCAKTHKHQISIASTKFSHDAHVFHETRSIQ
ncbi:fusaric acid resistance family protein [Rhodovulum bhavnagarense]|uniref:Fusaric acid resistance family protein n=1 Tax=Rhodovulum bhavnagarense TaxID=992286 RepID=A0A4R2REX7_9RHOB|nr:FUSC family protein [Rhodovulum bhavnagarense]TCP60968.1 fusaric acid resistance family protein [Rhodovulum bhavnagarense]